MKKQRQQSIKKVTSITFRLDKDVLIRLHEWFDLNSELSQSMAINIALRRFFLKENTVKLAATIKEHANILADLFSKSKSISAKFKKPSGIT